MKHIGWFIAGAAIGVAGHVMPDSAVENMYTIEHKEYVEGCQRVQQARLAMGMSMDQYWDQGCKRVLKAVD
jgi:hypothetical protein